VVTAASLVIVIAVAAAPSRPASSRVSTALWMAASTLSPSRPPVTPVRSAASENSRRIPSVASGSASDAWPRTFTRGSSSATSRGRAASSSSVSVPGSSSGSRSPSGSSTSATTPAPAGTDTTVHPPRAAYGSDRVARIVGTSTVAPGVRNGCGRVAPLSNGLTHAARR
jgi:hypothetical protein